MIDEETVNRFFSQEFVYRLLTGVMTCLFSFVMSFSIKRSGNATDLKTYFAPAEGIPIALAIRLSAFGQFLGVCLVFGLPHVTLKKLAYVTHCSIIPDSIRVLSLIPFGISVYLLYSVLRALGKQYSMSCDIKTHHKLVDYGPYGYVRHPMYTVLCLCWGSIAITSASYLIIFFTVIMLYVVMKYRTPIEEDMMKKSFGKEYEEYSKRVPARYFPSISTLLSQQKKD
jgi:protein-S-isoprenylcysteine O-methyltransferase Ste14